MPSVAPPVFLLLCKGPSYIRPNQSYLHCDQQQQKQVDRKFNKTLDVIVPYLVRVYHMSPTSTIISRFSHQLATYLCEQYMAPISYLHAYLARQERKAIKCFVSQFDKMMPKRENNQLVYLYFVPKPHKEGTPLRPIVSSMHMPTTYLCTFDITNLYTMLPQEESLDILTEFLLEHGYTKANAVPIDAIRKLARLVLTENVFTYEKRFYRQVIDGAMGSAFTLTLANVFLWKWEKRLVQQLYVDDIFFTSNQPLNKINEMLDHAKDFHPNIKLVRQIGKNVSFLDVLIENYHGTSKTSVYHKEAAEPYTVPFNSDHPHHTVRNAIDTALLRTVRYSSTLSTFQKEQRTIKLRLLYNNYAPRFIYSRFHNFITTYAKNFKRPTIHT
ncbi:unnamed protein product [Adineta ricciae]|uniref:Helix-turn-helix domain-containing protein n=1 Tax=Adineta ricciae TaxID=249248 RepID=A0A814TWL3_ADIRI|nr:unnamed protein product [Adineta ricciae]